MRNISVCNSLVSERLPVIVPDGQCGDWRIESFSVSEKESKETLLRAMAKGNFDEYVPDGEYKRLMHGGTVVMSNTPMEIRTNLEFIRRAKGHVLINGLGLGMVLSAILRKPEVLSVTVVEISTEVLSMVAPSFENESRVSIIQADALAYKPMSDNHFNVVWHDIWNYICADNLEDMRRLHRRYSNICDWQESWARDLCKKTH